VRRPPGAGSVFFFLASPRENRGVYRNRTLAKSFEELSAPPIPGPPGARRHAARGGASPKFRPGPLCRANGRAREVPGVVGGMAVTDR